MSSAREIAQWVGIGTAVLIGAFTLSQSAQFRGEDLGQRVARIEERTGALNIRELESSVSRLSSLVQDLQQRPQAEYADNISALEDAVEQLKQQLKSANQSSLSASEIADALVQNHLDILKGPPGVPGTTGSFANEDLDLIVKQVVEILDRRTDGSVSPSTSSPTAEQQTSESQVYRNGDCFEFDPNAGVKTTTLAHGGGICVRGIPQLAIRHTNGCAFVSFSGVALTKTRNLDPGETLRFSTGGKNIAFLMGCKTLDDGSIVYPVRIFSE